MIHAPLFALTNLTADVDRSSVVGDWGFEPLRKAESLQPQGGVTKRARRTKMLPATDAAPEFSRVLEASTGSLQKAHRERELRITTPDFFSSTTVSKRVRAAEPLATVLPSALLGGGVAAGPASIAGSREAPNLVVPDAVVLNAPEEARQASPKPVGPRAVLFDGTEPPSRVVADAVLRDGPQVSPAPTVVLEVAATSEVAVDRGAAKRLPTAAPAAPPLALSDESVDISNVQVPDPVVSEPAVRAVSERATGATVEAPQVGEADWSRAAVAVASPAVFNTRTAGPTPPRMARAESPRSLSPVVPDVAAPIEARAQAPETVVAASRASAAAPVATSFALSDESVEIPNVVVADSVVSDKPEVAMPPLTLVVPHAVVMDAPQLARAESPRSLSPVAPDVAAPIEARAQGPETVVAASRASAAAPVATSFALSDESVEIPNVVVADSVVSDKPEVAMPPLTLAVPHAVVMDAPQLARAESPRFLSPVVPDVSAPIEAEAPAPETVVAASRASAAAPVATSPALSDESVEIPNVVTDAVTQGAAPSESMGAPVETKVVKEGTPTGPPIASAAPREGQETPNRVPHLVVGAEATSTPGPRVASSSQLAPPPAPADVMKGSPGSVPITEPTVLQAPLLANPEALPVILDSDQVIAPPNLALDELDDPVRSRRRLVDVAPELAEAQARPADVASADRPALERLESGIAAPAAESGPVREPEAQDAPELVQGTVEVQVEDLRVQVDVRPDGVTVEVFGTSSAVAAVGDLTADLGAALSQGGDNLRRYAAHVVPPEAEKRGTVSRASRAVAAALGARISLFA